MHAMGEDEYADEEHDEGSVALLSVRLRTHVGMADAQPDPGAGSIWVSTDRN